MALVLKDRVRETTTVLGTNDATLLGAVTGFQAFSVVGNGNTCYYTIADQSGGNWEVGIGTYSSVGPTLARTTILASSNSNNIVSFPAGTKDVFLTYPSEKAVFLDASGNLNIEDDGELRLHDTSGTEYVALKSPGTLASTYTLTLPIDDGVSGQALITDGNGNLSWSTAASGDVYGPASATANGIALFDGTTGKLLKDSASTDGLINSLTVGRGASGVATNAAFGQSALASNTTGTSNTAIGPTTLNANTVGSANTAIGRQALRSNIDGGNNTAVGYQSIYSNTSGLFNSAVGVASLYGNTSGSYNVAFGVSALQANTTGSSNTAVGYQAGYSNTTGSDLVAIGKGAMLLSTTGSGSVAVGGNALYSAAGTYNVAVGGAALYINTGSYNTAVGGPDAGGIAVMRYNTSGQYNTALGNGSLAGNTTGSYNTAVGYQALYLNQTGNDNVAIGYLAGYNATTTGAVMIGTRAGSGNTTASNLTAVGYYAASGNGAAAQVTAVGYQALLSSTGSYNTAIGSDAMRNNTTGTRNVAVGTNANRDNATGSSNVAVGVNAMIVATSASNNVAIGDTALGNVSAGYSNIAVGYSALGSLTTGANNTVVGHTAGASLTAGGYSTLIGFRAGYSGNARNTCVGTDSGYNATGTLNTFIGDNAGAVITTGAKNTILGGYNGNQGPLDIRTLSNYIVLSDGDGNPRTAINSTGTQTIYHSNSVGTVVLTWSGDFFGYPCDAGSFNTANAGLKIQKVSATGRSINTAGTINASGADYAEYMTKAGDFVIAKGDVCGIDANGKLTNVFADAISFVVKSTDPSYVGGDSWGAKSQDKNGPQYTEAELEEQRQKVDRIAFAGQVPVNVIGATPGQYIIPVNDNGAIKGEAVGNPTFEQYQLAVGKVIAVESDGRARIIVKVA